MKKLLILLLFSTIFCLTACRHDTVQILDGDGMAYSIEDISEPESTDSILLPEGTSSADSSLPGMTETAVAANTDSESALTGIMVSQGGPYGKITLEVPADWNIEYCPIDSASMSYGCSYGIRISPHDSSEGYVEIAYINAFGVCGTGLETETISLAGCTAEIGTYDQRERWDFIAFDGPLKQVVAASSLTDTWSVDQMDEVMKILDTLTFDPEEQEGGAYIYETDSEVERLGLHFYLQHITPTGADLVFQQYDPTAQCGSLEFGDDFVLQKKEREQWIDVPVTLDGDYGFHDIAYSIAKNDITRQELNWEWLYGSLAPGSYRIGKSVHDFRDSGDYDVYPVYASFILR